MSEIFKDGLEDFRETLVAEEEAGFVVDDAGKADWCVRKIREVQNSQADEEKELKTQMEECLAFYQDRIKKLREESEYKVHFFEEKLKPYFATVQRKVTKTQESFSLPSGKIVLKHQAPEIQHDDEKILDWLHENSTMPETYIDFRETLKWGELKKVLTVAGDGMATQDGEMIPGITVTERPDKFVVEVK